MLCSDTSLFHLTTEGRNTVRRRNTKTIGVTKVFQTMRRCLFVMSVAAFCFPAFPSKIEMAEEQEYIGVIIL